MSNRNLKIISYYLSFILVFLSAFSIDLKVKAEEITFQTISQEYIDSLNGVLTIQNNIVYKLDEDIVISKDLRITTASGFGFLELNGYKITVASNVNVRMTNGVSVLSKDSAVRDNSSAAFKVDGFLLMFYANIDVPYSKAIETGQGGRAVVFNSSIKADSIGVLVNEGDCEIHGYSTMDIRNSENGIGVKVGQNGRAAIIKCGNINAAKPFDKDSGGKIYDFRSVANPDIRSGGVVSGTIVHIYYDDAQAQDAAGTVIKFTLDGSEPTISTSTEISSVKRRASIVIEGDLTIRLIAFVDGQSYELEPLSYNIGVASYQEFMDRFNSIRNEGGTIILADSINFTGQNELNADSQVNIITNSYRLCADGTGNKLTIGGGVSVEGNGSNGQDRDFGVIAALNGGQLIINPGSVIRATSDTGIAVKAFEGGVLVINGGNIYGKKQAVFVDDNNKNANTNAQIFGGTLEVSGAWSIGVHSLGGAKASVEGTTVINAYGDYSIGAGAFGFGNVVIKGNSVINSNANNGLCTVAREGGNLIITENASINSRGYSGRGVSIGVGGGLNVNGSTINVEGPYGMGIEADGENAKVVMTGGIIKTTGNNCTGALAKAKAEINIKGNSKINVEGIESTGIDAVGSGAIIVGDTVSIDTNGDRGIGVSSNNGSTIDISGNTVINSMGVEGSGVIVGTGGTININSGSVNAKKFGLNVYTTDKNAKSLLNISSPVVVKVDLNNENSLGLIVSGEGATCKIGDLIIDAPKPETVYVKTPIENVNLEKYIPYVSGNLNIDWYLDNYNGDVAGEYELSGFVQLPQNININQVVFLSKYLTVKYNEVDFNQDAKVDILDLSLMTKNYNYKTSNPKWKVEYDLNNDGIIDIYDLVKMSKLL